jgi:hypothetical protein
MFHFVEKKINSAEVERLEKLLDRLERRWRVVFQEFIDRATSDEVIRRVANLIERGRQMEAIEIVDQLVVKMSNSVIPPSFTLVATTKVEELQEQLLRLRPMVSVSFDPTNAAAVAIQQKQQLEFITNFTEGQREATNAALVNAFEVGKNPLATANYFKGSIGLTPKQLKAVENYRRLLQEGSMEALGRDIRDRRFDVSTRAAFERGEPLSAEQIEKMVERYRVRYIKYRADVIARTESGRTLNEANREAFRQTVAMAGFEDNQIKRSWVHTRDQRTRWSHSHMRVGVVAGMNTPFVTGAGVTILHPNAPDAPVEEIAQCRCVEIQEFVDV